MIKKYLTFINEKIEYGNKFVPIRVFHDEYKYTNSRFNNTLDEYERIIQELMVGKYAMFSIIKNEPNEDGDAGGLIEGYVRSVNLMKGVGNLSVKMKGLFGRTYVLDVLSEVRVYNKKPKLIKSDIDPLGEEIWDD